MLINFVGILFCRFMFYERKRDRRDTRIKGLLLAAAIGVGDYIAAII
jgi:hypothetical protein